MNAFRRDFLKIAGAGVAGALGSATVTVGARAQAIPAPEASPSGTFDVRRYGAAGEGKTIDSPATDAKPWNYQQIGGFHADALLHELQRADAVFQDPKYAAAVRQLGAGKADLETLLLARAKSSQN